jgi:hypothetical protein
LAADGSSLKDRSAGAKDHAAASAIDDLLVKESAHAIEMLDLQTPFAQTFPNTALAWFGFWQSPVLSAAQMPLLESVLSVVLRRHEGTADPEFLDDLLRFIDALNLAVQHDLPLHVELVPRGHSDGQTWTLARHCERCRLSIPPSETAWRSCPACGNQQSAPERKLKVLGLRPYVSLARVLGLERTKTFLEKYEAATVNNSPADSVNRPERP